MIKTRAGGGSAAPKKTPAKKPASPKKPLAKEPETMEHDPMAVKGVKVDPATLGAATSGTAPAETKTIPAKSNEFVFEIHPLAEVYPHMSEEVYDAFKEGILNDGGIQDAITVIEDPTRENVLLVIDGRHRHSASVELGLPIKYEFYNGPLDEDSLRLFVERRNAHRRDLTAGQRAISAAKLYVGKPGRPKKVSPEETVSDDMTEAAAEKIAKRAGVSLSYFRKAVRVNGVAKRFPDFVSNVHEGKLDLAPAYDMVADFEQTDTKLKKLGITVSDFKKVGEHPSSIGEILRRAKQAAKKDKRDARDEKISKVAQALPDDEFQIVYADPAWKFEVRSEQGMDRSAENHYPTQTFEEIVQAKPAFAKQAVLFLWTTIPHLKQAMDLLDVWGLEYKSHLIWGKDYEITGYWTRGKHEILLIATTEDGFPAPLPGDQLPSLRILPSGKHSEKPEEFAKWIETIWPTAKKLEMYCRAPREGWTHWGFEANGVLLDDQEEVSQDDEMDEEDRMMEEAESAGGEHESDLPDDWAPEDTPDAPEPPAGAEDDDGFFDSAAVPKFLREKVDPLGVDDDDQPPGL